MSESKTIDLALLLLDEENPRLPSSVPRRQEDMIDYIAKTTSISEIMSAIAENDYFPGEPLIVIPGKDGYFIAVEGNRRLTALKLLQDPGLQPRSKKIAEIAAKADFRPTDIPCVLFKTRGEVTNYLGYRHITGVKQWEPLAKARYIASYFDTLTNPNDDPSIRYAEVARGIGSQGPYIKRQLDGMAIYLFVESKLFFGIDGLDEENISFSLLSTAVGYESVLRFVSSDPHPYVNKGSLREENCERLTRWMFEKDDEGATALGDSRNIQRLAVILEDAEATERLLDGDSMDVAYAKTRGMSEDMLAILIDAERYTTQAVSMIALVEITDAHRRRISNLYRQAGLLERQAEPR